MTSVVVDVDLAAKLCSATDAVELRDPSGRVLGRFVPASDLSEWEPVSPDVSEEELDRRERSSERRFSTAEVLAHLKKL